MSRLQHYVYFKNKDTLQVMSYLSKTSKQFDSYLDLKFNLNLDEVISVADKTRELCKYDLRAFCFLTNYLLISFINL